MRFLPSVALVLLLVPSIPAQEDKYDPKDDETSLKELGLSSDGASLVKYFRNLILPKANEQRVLELIKQLGHNDFDERQKASTALRGMGPAIVPLLKLHVESKDPEIAQRAKECLEHVRKSSTEHLVSAAARLIAHRQPSEAVAVLLEYAKYVKDPIVMEAFRHALTMLAVKDKKPHPSLIEAVKSKENNVRLLAKSALTASKAVDGETARGYLDDPLPLARLRVALALVRQQDRSMVPELIKLLPLVELEQAWEAEAILYQLAGAKPPDNVSLDDATDSRKRARDEWMKWWNVHQETVKLDDLNKRKPFLGLTLVTFQDNFGRGHVMEMDRNKEKRWSLDTLNFPIDAEMLPNGNVLVAEMYSARVAEWNVKTKKTVWEYKITNPVAVQSLPNGRVLIAALRELIVYNKATKKVEMRYTANQQKGENTYSARALANGELLLITSRSQVVRIDAKGKELKRFSVPGINNYCTIHVLPNQRVLIPQYSTSRVSEYTLDGKAVWSASVRYPTSAYRLPNGNTLVTSMGGRNVVELTRAASPKVVHTIPIGGSPWHVRRR